VRTRYLKFKDFSKYIKNKFGQNNNCFLVGSSMPTLIGDKEGINNNPPFPA
jgi:hypothetical protein